MNDILRDPTQSSDYLRVSTWRQYFEFNYYGSESYQFRVPFRMVSMEGAANSETRKVVVVYLIPALYLGIMLDHLTPPVHIKKENRCLIPQFNNMEMPQTDYSHEIVKTLRAVDVRWRAHIPDKPVDPLRTDKDWAYSTGGNPAFPNYDYASMLNQTYGHVVELRVTYDNSIREVDPDDPWTWLDIRADSSAEFLAMTGKNASWRFPSAIRDEDNPNLFNLPITKIIPCTQWTLQWKHVPEDDFHKIMKPILDDAIGKVNALPFSKIIKAQEHGEDTLMGYLWNVLFVGYSIVEEGEVVWGDQVGKRNPLTVEMQFLERTIKKVSYRDADDNPVYEVIGWNHVYNDGGTAGASASDDNRGWQLLFINGEKLYESYDFNLIFDCDAQRGELAK